MTQAEAWDLDQASISLLRQLKAVLTGQTAQVVTSVLVGMLASVASVSDDPDHYCLQVAREAIRARHTQDGPMQDTATADDPVERLH